MTTSPQASLQALRRLSPDVEAALVVDADGAIEALHASDELAESLAPMVTTLTALAERAAMELGRGGLTRLVLDGTGGRLVAQDLGAGRVMAAVAGRDAPLGLLLDDLNACAEHLRA